MSYPRPIEAEALEPIEMELAAALRQVSGDERNRARLEFLGLVSSIIGGYRAEWLGKWMESAAADAAKFQSAKRISLLFTCLPMPPALALAALARPDTEGLVRRQSGAIYTDFRLAQHLASTFKRGRPPKSLLDPACGSGILLCASTLALAGDSRRRIDEILGDTICGADLSAQALRGAALSLCSLTGNRFVIQKLLGRLRPLDSLSGGLAGWPEFERGFDAVIANPPWERAKITRHEALRISGVERHYGDHYRGESLDGIQDAKARLRVYLEDLRGRFLLQGAGDPDLYKFFVELILTVARPGGRISLLVPAGLIRSQGTHALRQALLDRLGRLNLTIFDNKPRFFAIDSRFKFLSIDGEKRKQAAANDHIRLRYGGATEIKVSSQPAVAISSLLLARLRPDLSIPEVRSAAEWKLFRSMSESGRKMALPEAGWSPEIVREVDMTLDRSNFRKNAFDGRVPLIEGRMIHQFHFGIKQHIAGTGRRAIWRTISRDQCAPLRPQFFFPVDRLSDGVRARIMRQRAGFCDISGQTNERTMLAAMIPANVVCGNKVPTVSFPAPWAEERMFAWIAVCNSFAFDWILRRVVTTTINFFHLLDMPTPIAEPKTDEFKALAETGRRLSLATSCDPWERAKLRAEADLAVLGLYEQDLSALRLILDDFPLLDRGQPALPGERRSTITRDFLLSIAMDRIGTQATRERDSLRNRVSAARLVGAVPYIPSLLRDTAYTEDSSGPPAAYPNSRDSARRRKEAASAI